MTERDFRELFEATNQAMIVGDRDGYIVSLNDPAIRLLGTEGQAVTGQHIADLLPAAEGTGSFGSIRRGGYLRPDSTTIDLAILSTPLALGDDAAILTTVWSTGDPIEDRPNASTAGEIDPGGEKMAALERMSERVSHEFNNILTSITGFASLIRADKTLEETTREHSKQIIEAAQLAEHLTAELLTFGKRSRPDGGKFSPARVISAVDPHMRKILGSGIELTTLCEEGCPPIGGSADALAQILLQLASNTSEAMDGAVDGLMKIELGTDDSGVTHLVVSDDGPGMDPVTSAAAFEPFFSTRQEGGMRGLGLARVYAAARSLRGSVSLESQPGTGTRFHFRFPSAPVSAPTLASERHATVGTPANGNGANAAPLSAPPAASPGSPPAPAPRPQLSALPRGNETILVVEDEPMVREIVVRSLTHLGYTVHKACDGQEGLERSRELADEVDLIFSDIVMPRLSGPEMMEKVREEARSTPVLFTTGFTESKHLLENGGDLREGIDLLQKPYTPSVLAERVREKLDSLIS
ncbi:MAG: hybrid sensor histidine kinase/response regulator [Verrucomicrobiales bacterium]